MNKEVNGSVQCSNGEPKESQPSRKLIEEECTSTNKQTLQAGTSNHCSSVGTSANEKQIDAHSENNQTKYDIRIGEAINTRKLLNSEIRNNTETVPVKFYEHIYDSNSDADAAADDDDDDEHCVYTYKGAEADDNFLEMSTYFSTSGQNGRERDPTCSSPEMDFLEMDFDPGPHNDQDSDEERDSLQIPSSKDHINLHPPFREPLELYSYKTDTLKESCDENANCFSMKAVINPSNSENSKSVLEVIDAGKPCCSKSIYKSKDEKTSSTESCCKLQDTYPNNSDVDDKINAVIENNILRYTTNFAPVNKSTCKVFDEMSDDSDQENRTPIPKKLNCVQTNKNQIYGENFFYKSFINENLVEKDLISSEDLLPIDPSYCISAVLNAVRILNIVQDPDDRDRLISLLQLKRIPDSTPLVEYLFMRSVQNANEIELSNFALNVFENKLHSRFFSTHMNIQFSLMEWLHFWMEKGAVPVITRNIQEHGVLIAKNIIRNPWRHNVVYKIEPPYIYVTNPLEKIENYVLHGQLLQPALIYVKSKKILQKWNSRIDLRSLLKANHNRWYKENVLGQVVTVIRENCSGNDSTQFVKIPSNCHCGITLFVPSNNKSLCKEIDETPKLL